MTIGIVTDSTCDLPDEIITQYGIAVVPLYINFGLESYLDGVDTPVFGTHLGPGAVGFACVHKRRAR